MKIINFREGGTGVLSPEDFMFCEGKERLIFHGGSFLKCERMENSSKERGQR